MERLGFSRYALSTCVATALLAGCGALRQAQDDMQPPIGALGATHQSPTIATHAQRGGSWMQPEAKMQDLLYVSNNGTSSVWVFSYPGGRLVGTLGVVGAAFGLCSDEAGNVFIVERSGDVVEYAHGGSSPIATFDDSYYGPNGCAVDPTTGNLAVAGGCLASYCSNANVAIFTDPTSRPARYSYPNDDLFSWCSYDDHGNLFVNGKNFKAGDSGLVELSKGSSTLQGVSVNGNIHGGGAIQWDGTYLALAKGHGGLERSRPATIYRLQISGGIGKIVSAVELNGSLASQPVFESTVEFWIDKNTIVSPRTIHRYRAGLWQYPTGGNPFRGNARVSYQIYGLTVSDYVAQPRRAQR